MLSFQSVQSCDRSIYTTIRLQSRDPTDIVRKQRSIAARNNKTIVNSPGFYFYSAKGGKKHGKDVRDLAINVSPSFPVITKPIDISCLPFSTPTCLWIRSVLEPMLFENRKLGSGICRKSSFEVWTFLLIKPVFKSLSYCNKKE